MFGDPEDAGTVEADAAGGGDAAAVADVDAGGAEEAPKKKVTIPFEEYESLKRKAREGEGGAKVERSERATTTDSRSPETIAQQRRVDEEEDLMSRLKFTAEQRDKDGNLVDPYTAAQFALYKRNLAVEQRNLYRMEMQDVPDSKRELVRDVMAKKGFTSPYAAYRFVRGDEADTLEQENRDLKARLSEKDKPKAKVEGTKMPAAVGRTGKDGGPKDIPYQEWVEGMADPARRKALKAAKRAGAKIVYTK